MKSLIMFFLVLIVATTAIAQGEIPEETFQEATLVAEDDYAINQSYGPYDLGFSFTYFGETYSQIYIGLGGIIGFNSWGMQSDSNDPIPYAPAIPDNFIAAFHDALAFWHHGGAIYFDTIGTAPNRKCIVQFTNMSCRSSGCCYEFLGTFSIILYESTNEIQLQYRKLSDQVSTYVHGASASIGLESSWATYGVQYSYNTATLSSGMAIRFTPDSTTNYTIDDSAEYDPILLGVGSRPDDPILIYPENGATAPQNVTLQWSAAEGATSYEVLYDNTSSMTFPDLVDTVTSTEFTIPTTLTNGSTYYWTVHALNSDDESWSYVNSFTASSSAPISITGNAGMPYVILNYNDGVAKSDTANINGDYTFTVTDNWTGTVTPSLAGYTFSPESRDYSSITTSQIDQDYSATQYNPTISGNAGVEGVIISYTDSIVKEDTTDVSGNFSFTVSYDWSGTIIPSKDNYTFSPDSIVFENVITDQVDQNFSPSLVTGIDEDQNSILPNEFSLKQNYPNPFNPSTEFKFDLPERTHIIFEIFNIAGQKIAVLADKEFTAGTHSLTWDGSNASSGIYLYRLNSDNYTSTKKMILLK